MVLHGKVKGLSNSHCARSGIPIWGAMPFAVAIPKLGRFI
jgi:hypothetical protein